MSKIKLGIILGIINSVVEIGLLSVAHVPNMVPTAIAAVTTRFAIGLLIPNSDLKLPYLVQGLIISTFLSITPATLLQISAVPIMMDGIVGGLVLGAITSKVIKKETA